jgi:hypothetical protein
MTFIQHAKVPTYSTNRGLSKNAIKKVVILIGSKDIVFAKSLWRTGQVYSRLHKIYMVVNMKYAICRGSVLPDRLGLNQCLLIGKPPPPILDLLSDVIPPSIENFMHSEMERGGLN